MRFLAALLATALPAFALAENSSVCPLPAELSASTPAAQINGKIITVAELDASMQEQLCAMRREYATKLDEFRRSAARELLDEKLLEAEVKARKAASIEELLMGEFAKLPPVSEADVKAFYEEHKGELDGIPYEVAEKGIRGYLENAQREAVFNDYMTKLRAATPNKILLPVQRFDFKPTGFMQGDQKAPVKIVLFADYQCPFCARALPVVDALQAKYKNKLQFYFQDLPLDFHDMAMPAAVLAHCASEQGKYWEMHKELFSFGGNLSSEAFEASAKKLGLDDAKLTACQANAVNPGGIIEKINESKVKAAQIGVNGTPAFLINGRLISGLQSVEDLSAVIDEELTR